MTIDVTNVEEPGTVTLSTLQPQLGEAITATLADPDDVTDDHHLLAVVPWHSRHYKRDRHRPRSRPPTFPWPAMVAADCELRPSYNDGEGADKTAQANSYRSIRNAPSTNTPPLFPVQTGARKVAENTPAGRNLGAAFTASDSGDVLTYSLAGLICEADLFSINRATGQLSTKAKLDYEDTAQVGQDRELVVIVTATDPFGEEAMVTVTITVTDVNEAPTLTAGATSIDRAEDITTLTVASYTATDADRIGNQPESLEWSLSGADSSKFSITAGALTFKAAPAPLPDYESPGDSNRNNVYEVTVVVTDSKGNSDERDVTVKVTNVEEHGTVTLSTLQPRVDVPVTATLADPDSVTVSSISWQWYQGSITIDTPDTTTTSETITSLPTVECATGVTENCFNKGATSATYTPVANDATENPDCGSHLHRRLRRRRCHRGISEPGLGGLAQQSAGIP